MTKKNKTFPLKSGHKFKIKGIEGNIKANYQDKMLLSKSVANLNKFTQIKSGNEEYDIDEFEYNENNSSNKDIKVKESEQNENEYVSDTYYENYDETSEVADSEIEYNEDACDDETEKCEEKENDGKSEDSTDYDIENHENYEQNSSEDNEFKESDNENSKIGDHIENESIIDSEEVSVDGDNENDEYYDSECSENNEVNVKDNISEIDSEEDNRLSIKQKLAHKFNEQKKYKPGILYLSRIPPAMNTLEIKSYFENYASIGRIYLQKKGVQNVHMKKKVYKKHRFTEGWIEVLSKRKAKLICENLNNTLVGCKKNHPAYDFLWSIKYLPGFKWRHLYEQMNYEAQVYGKKLQAEMAQVYKETSHYYEQSGKEKTKLKKKLEKNSSLKNKHQSKVKRKDLAHNPLIHRKNNSKRDLSSDTILAKTNSDTFNIKREIANTSNDTKIENRNKIARSNKFANNPEMQKLLSELDANNPTEESIKSALLNRQRPSGKTKSKPKKFKRDDLASCIFVGR